jgi:mono/diheme cytochrome c family protein
MLVVLLFSYEIISVDVTSFMEDQPSIDYQESPRRLLPEGSIPLSQPLYGGATANPVPADEVSLQRGEILYQLHCAVCHGPTGLGDGPVVQFWRESARRPADLTEVRIAEYPGGTIYRIISQGIGGMPPLRENLTERQRWDVINYVRSLP